MGSQACQKVIKERKYQPGEWSDLEIHAAGKDVSVRINGILSTELKNDPGQVSKGSLVCNSMVSRICMWNIRTSV